MFHLYPAGIFLRPYGTSFMVGTYFPGVETYGLYSIVPAGLVLNVFPIFKQSFLIVLWNIYENYGIAMAFFCDRTVGL